MLVAIAIFAVGTVERTRSVERFGVRLGVGDDLNGTRVRQVLIHGCFHFLNPLVEILVVLLELLKLL